jgi:hypothetical protein
MLLVAVFVLTNTVSADGSISGVYRASMNLAQQSNVGENANEGLKEFTNGLKELVRGQPSQPNSSQTPEPGTQKQPAKQNNTPAPNEQNKR